MVPPIIAAFAAATLLLPFSANAQPGPVSPPPAPGELLPGPVPLPPGASRDPAAVRAGTYELETSHAKITWAVSHIGYSRYQGQFAGLQGRMTLDPAALERASLEVTVPIARLGTLDRALDDHLRAPDFFDEARFPLARFASTRVERTGERTARVHGELTLRDVTRPAAFDATFNQAGPHPVTGRYTIGFDGRAVIRRSEWGITTLVNMISDDVALHIEGDFMLRE